MAQARRTLRTLGCWLRLSGIGPVAANLAMAFVAFTLCRGIFLWVNASEMTTALTARETASIFGGGLMFDASAICYLTLLYVVMALVPLPSWSERRGWQTALRLAFVVPVAFGVLLNLGDSVFFPFNHRRITWMVFDEFSNEGNLLRIALIECGRRWYLVALYAAVVWLLWRLYRKPSARGEEPRWRYVAARSGALLVVGFLMLTGMRGSLIMTATRPISIGEAHRFVSRPERTAVVINTPFSLIRTFRKTTGEPPRFFSQERLAALFDPVHRPRPDGAFDRRNVVIIIVESLSEEFVGSRNRYKQTEGYTPFVDSLLSVGLTWEQTFANAGFSIDAMPAVLASLPRMDHPFVLTPYSMNAIDGIAMLLRPKGYVSAFFHGGENQSMGFNAFARHAGFEGYFGLDEYCADGFGGGSADFDSTWGIWDEEFLQYTAGKLSTLGEPFVAAVFTLSSHHPFAVPERYKDRFVDDNDNPMHKCISYTDNALRLFFETASRQPWFGNTVFLITADHASPMTDAPEYRTEIGRFRIPLIIYDPSGRWPRATLPGIAQQIDMMPTLLGLMNYDLPYVAFGSDLMVADSRSRFAFNWDHLPQIVVGDTLLQLSEEGRPTALYDLRADPAMLRDRLADTPDSVTNAIADRARAMMQSFMERGKRNQFTIRQQ